MKKILAALAAFTIPFLFALPASASTQINWTGQGSDNLPCATGGHWVLTGKGITGANVTVGDESGAAAQRGKGSWYFDTDGPVTANTVAYAVYEGTAKNPQFVLSHCLEGEQQPTDECPNLEGDQATVPDGYVKDEQGNCVTDDDPEPIKVRAEVRFSDPTCDDSNGSEVGVVQVEGVSYQIVGNVEPGGHVTVIATADEGYVLVGPNEWDHTYPYLEGCGEEPPVDVCEEDEPCWDCETDGNGDCGEPNEPNKYEPKGDKPEGGNDNAPELPHTGANTWLAVVAGLLIAAGSGLVIAGRRA